MTEHAPACILALMISAPVSDLPLLRRDLDHGPICTWASKPHRRISAGRRSCTEPRTPRRPRTYRGFGRPDVGLTSNALFAANRLASVTDPAGASTMEYDAAGRLTKRTDPNGVVMTYSYDNVNRVLDVAANRGTTPVADYAYTRDTIGRVTTLAELGGRTVTYGYSQAGRLVNETITGESHGINGVIAYTHDSVGNRLTRTSSVGPVAGQAFAYDGNDRIVSEAYDLNGNTLQAEGDSLAYDFEDRLVAIGSGVGIAYDAEGNLISRSEAGVATAYLVDEIGPSGWSQVVEEITGAVVSKTYAYSDSPLRTSVGGLSRGYLADGHTNIRLLTDTNGVVSDEYDYEAFGTGTRTVGATANVLKYTGERAETGGLTFLRARHVRVGTGRFLVMDSLEGDPSDAASLHRYLYANGDPVCYQDPSGQESIISSSIATGINSVFATLAFASYRGYVGVVATVRLAQLVAGKINPDKLFHLFGQAKHHFGPLLQYFGGSQTAAASAIQTAVVAANTGKPEGFYSTIVQIGPYLVTVEGTIINGVTRIGTAFIP